MKGEKWEKVEEKEDQCGKTIWYLSDYKNGDRNRPQRIRMLRYLRC